MKAPSNPAPKTKTVTDQRRGRVRAGQGELFLGYKALHELRILLRIAASPNLGDPTRSKASY